MTDAATQQVEELMPLLRLIVWERCGSQTWLRDDALQEASLAAWTRLAEGHSPGIAVFKAKQAVVDLLRGGRQTGSKHTHGGRTDSHTRSTSIFKQGDDGEGYVLEPADESAERAVETIDLRTTLEVALVALPDRDREIVRQIFWEDRTQAEVAKDYGVTPQAISLRLRKSYDVLRPVLA